MLIFMLVVCFHKQRNYARASIGHLFIKQNLNLNRRSFVSIGDETGVLVHEV